MMNQQSTSVGNSSNNGPLALLHYLHFIMRKRGIRAAIDLFTDLYQCNNIDSIISIVVIMVTVLAESELLTSEVYIAVAYSIVWYGYTQQQQQQQKEEVDDYDYIQRKSTAISVLRKGIKR